jgi:spermidine synthase
VSIHINDGRHFMQARKRKYDVIVSDLFVPWESETGYLYTVEHYQLVLDRLKTGGLFCQCLALYQVGTREFELIANSLATVFPHVTLWWLQVDSARPVIALIGTNTKVTIESESMDDRLRSLWQEIGTADELIRDSGRLMSLYQGDWPGRAGAVLNTDENPRVEFLTPISIRDRKMISGGLLMSYFDGVLNHLPFSEASLTGKGTAPLDARIHRANLRFLLFGE